MNLSEDNYFPPITDLIPQRPPIVLVDQVVACDGHWTTTSYRIPDEGLFIEDGHLSEMGLIENMAQSSFVFLHYLPRLETIPQWVFDPNAIGYISNIVKLSVQGKAPCGNTLKTQLETELVFTSDILKICKVSGHSTVENEIIFTAQMTMLLQSKES